MTELDLGLKVGARRLFWGLGYSTRLDVELRAERPASSRPGPAETFTDLDVLGVQVTPGYQLTTAIADCKTGSADKPTARMFWARGVADLFGANQIFLVRDRDVNEATRQLSSKLKITVLPSGDLTKMQALHPISSAETGSPLALLFDRTAVAASLSAFTGLDRRLRPLLEYRQFDYWVYEDHSNLIQMVAHISAAATRLDSRNPIHQALILDLTWLYLLTLIRVTEHVRGAFISDADRGLQEYLCGGATGLQEKMHTAAILDGIKPPGAPTPSYLPPYYNQLRELVTRLLRRPNEMQTALRYAEAASALAAARQRTTLAAAFGDQFSPFAAKLVADVCGFLVAAGELDSGFRSQARAYLLAEPIIEPEPKGAARTAPATRQVDPVSPTTPSHEHTSSANESTADNNPTPEQSVTGSSDVAPPLPMTES